MDTVYESRILQRPSLEPPSKFQNVLGAGFREKVYEWALTRELILRGVSTKAQVLFPICYKANVWGVCG